MDDFYQEMPDYDVGDEAPRESHENDKMGWKRTTKGNRTAQSRRWRAKNRDRYNARMREYMRRRRAKLEPLGDD